MSLCQCHDLRRIISNRYAAKKSHDKMINRMNELEKNRKDLEVCILLSYSFYIYRYVFFASYTGLINFNHLFPFEFCTF